MKNIVFAFCACLLVACAGEKQDSGRENESGHEHEKEDTFNFSKEKAATVGLQTKVVQPETFTEVIKTSGRILSAQGDEQTLVATLSGVVSFKKTPFIEGSAVRKGQVVLSLLTDRLPDGDIVVRTRAAYEKAKNEYERAQELVKDRIISEREFNQTISDYETAKAAFDAIGGTRSRAEQGIDIYSPINGYLKDLRVKEGDYVETGYPLATVSQNNRLQLRVELPEKYYSSLPLIQTADFKTPYNDAFYRLAELNGRLLSYAKSMDSDIFYIPVTFEFDNKGEILPGGYVDAYLYTRPVPDVISVPISSLIEEQGIYSVFLQEDEDCYRKQPVRIGANNGSSVRIIDGLKAGDIVVTEAAYHLKLASVSNALPDHHH
jgi:RND family efflux transporter MFP subunit